MWKEILVSLVRVHEWKFLHPNWERDSEVPLRQCENGFPSFHYWKCVNWDSQVYTVKMWIEVLVSTENVWNEILALLLRKRELRFSFPFETPAGLVSKWCWDDVVNFFRWWWTLRRDVLGNTGNWDLLGGSGTPQTFFCNSWRWLFRWRFQLRNERWIAGYLGSRME